MCVCMSVYARVCVRGADMLTHCAQILMLGLASRYRLPLYLYHDIQLEEGTLLLWYNMIGGHLQSRGFQVIIAIQSEGIRGEGDSCKVTGKSGPLLGCYILIVHSRTAWMIVEVA